MDDVSRDTLWWTTPEYPNDNKPLPVSSWVWKIKNLENQTVFQGKIVCIGCISWEQSEANRIKVFYNGSSMASAFRKNMFIRPTEEELANFGESDFRY